MCVHAHKTAQFCPTLCSWTVARQASLSMGFFWQEHWSGLSCPSPGDLPNRRIEPRSPILQAGCLLSQPPGKLDVHIWVISFSFVNKTLFVLISSKNFKIFLDNNIKSK